MEPIHQKVGRNLLAIRKARSLSLERVSELTGVSKAMLGQIERGDSNPTISVLWKIVNGLHISFTSLIEESEPSVSITRLEDLSPFMEAEGSFRSYPLIPYNQRKRFEVFIVEMEAGCTHESEPHNEGVEESIYVIQGELQVTIQNEVYNVKQESAIQFQGDLPHIYHNPVDQKTKFYALIYYSS
ncbi:helix-turn-helix domain-containing protein [Paenibacillus sp. J2TS4]|uniref:helix-turn-helix domain-containing protein n=1 Tax=Paenibacillus sp. J2TS4 TaxID=2807194 RepID=UPI001AFD494C|nr:XRE family transcriptional regulator [Paenibacillus sp. J2TS4]GIP32192.1 transcriptional regulator [Paenibacillus sp. J2TS4]